MIEEPRKCETCHYVMESENPLGAVRLYCDNPEGKYKGWIVDKDAVCDDYRARRYCCDCRHLAHEYVETDVDGLEIYNDFCTNPEGKWYNWGDFDGQADKCPSDCDYWEARTGGKENQDGNI